jgi:hypothetical protein
MSKNFPVSAGVVASVAAASMAAVAMTWSYFASTASPEDEEAVIDELAASIEGQMRHDDAALPLSPEVESHIREEVRRQVVESLRAQDSRGDVRPAVTQQG